MASSSRRICEVVHGETLMSSIRRCTRASASRPPKSRAAEQRVEALARTKAAGEGVERKSRGIGYLLVGAGPKRPASRPAAPHSALQEGDWPVKKGTKYIYGFDMGVVPG